MTRRRMSQKQLLGGLTMDIKKQQQPKTPSQNPAQKPGQNIPGKQEQYQPNKGNPSQKKPGSNW